MQGSRLESLQLGREGVVVVWYVVVQVGRVGKKCILRVGKYIYCRSVFQAARLVCGSVSLGKLNLIDAMYVVAITSKCR